MLDDIRFAIRQLRKTPAFCTLTIVTLAIGIGMNTAMFTLIHDLFLRGLPFSEPDRVVHIYGEAKERDLKALPFSVPRFWHFRDSQTVFSSIAADWFNGFILTGQGEPVQVIGGNVTANYFDLLGIRPVLGRNFLPEEEMKADVAVITSSFWRHRLNSDPAVLGRNISLNGTATTIVGILPDLPVSWFGRDAEVFIVKPFENPNTTKERLMLGYSFMRCIARLKPGVTMMQAQAAMVSLAQSYRAGYPAAADNTWTVSLMTAAEDATGNLRPAFITLLAAVGAVLVIACSNVANLLLVRFTGRRREIALRMALGAERSEVVRLFILESLTTSIIAGVIGVCLAMWIVSIVPRVAGANIPFETHIALNTPVLGFALLLSILTGIGMGVYPAWQSSRADLVGGLKEGGRSVSGDRAQHRFRRGLVAAQVGLSTVLLAAAVMLITSFIRLSTQQSGFHSDHVWAGGIGLPSTHYPDAAARGRFVRRLRENLQTAPGVQSTATADALPLSGNWSSTPFARTDTNPPPVNKRPLGLTRSVSPGYFQTLQIPLLSGRDFNERDTAESPLVVLLSNSTAKKIFPNENPIGHQIYFGTDNGTGLVVEVIGVVGDVRSLQLAKTNDVEFYRPWPQRSFAFFNLMVRSATKPEATANIVRQTLDQIDRDMPILQPSTLDQLVTQSLGEQRLTMGLLGVFAGVALLLAVVGIYAAVAYTVEQRTAEIGVRMALGAQVNDVLRLVVRQGMSPVVIGLALGLLATFGAGRLIAAQLYQVSPNNPMLIATAVSALAVAALLACLIPARRATLVNPIEALRTE
jgi:putative ABC transport system permease protein